MQFRFFSALAATFFLGTAVFASVATSIVYAFPPKSTHIIVENLSESDERERGVTQLEHGLDLSRRDLAGVRIVDAFLRDVDFSGSDLTGADLRFTQFFRCNFSNANLTNVAITDSGSFRECNFSGAKLQNVDISEVDDSPAFVDCDFTGATLKGLPEINYSTFKNCVLKDVYLADVIARDIASFDINSTSNVKKYREFEGVVLHKTPKDLFGFVLTRSNLLGDLGDVDLTDARLTKIWALGLSGRQLAQTVNFREKRYEGLTLQSADFKKYDFSGALLTNCRFEKIDFTDANFTDAVLTACAFHDVQGLTLEQLKSTWNWRAGRLDFLSLDDALQAEVDAALAETQPDKPQDVAKAKRAETAAAFDLAPDEYSTSYEERRRYVPSNLIFDAIPYFRVAALKRRYQVDPNVGSFVTYPLSPDDAIVIQGSRPPQERFIVELTGNDSRTATLQVEYLPNDKSCRDRILDILAEDGEKRWRRGGEPYWRGEEYFIATGGDAPKSRLVFTCRSVIFDLTFDDKTSLKEAEAVRRYITETSHKACNKLAMPEIYGR